MGNLGGMNICCRRNNRDLICNGRIHKLVFWAGFSFPFCSLSVSPVLSELQSSVSFSALCPGLGPCFIHVVMVNWWVRFCGTTQSGILAAWRPSKRYVRSLSRPPSVTRVAVQLKTPLGAGRRSVLPDEAPGMMPVSLEIKWIWNTDHSWGSLNGLWLWSPNEKLYRFW